MKTEAYLRVVKARSALIYSQPFYGTLALNLLIVETEEIDTFATDGRHFYFNAACVAKCSDAELIWSWAHEVGHNALHHCTRRGGREHPLWNVACDHAINLNIEDAGFKTPEWALLDRQYEGLASEAIYRLLDQQRRQQKQEQQEQQQQPNDGAEGSDESDDDGDGEDQGADDGSDQPEGGSVDDGDVADDDGDDDASDGGAGGEQPDGNVEPQDGTGTGGANDQRPGSEESDDGEPIAGTEGKMIGDVLDAEPDSEGKTGEIEANWDVLVRQAINVAKAHEAGDMPGYLQRIAEENAKPKVDWRDVLRRFWSPSSTQRSTWARPSRRFVSSGLFLPGNVTDGVNHVVWINDTSGSMDDVALSQCRAELQAALDEGVVDLLTVIDCDTAVRNVNEFTRGDQLVFDAVGGGGTAFAPAFAYIREHGIDCAGVVYFTDLDCYSFGTEPDCPVLWAAYGDPRRLPALMQRVPFGECLEIAY
jgi:predicted metal-dependent peptidase